MPKDHDTMMKIFISYAHADEWLKDEFIQHLSALRRNGLIDVWHDRVIPPGDKLKIEIDKNLSDSQMVILLVSPAFIASDYCIAIEYEQAKAMQATGETRIIPVIVRDCDWDVDDLKSFNALPQDGVAVTTKAVSKDDAQQRDAAWNAVVKGLKPLIEAQKKSSNHPS